MPKEDTPNVGDVVLYSSIPGNFTNPTIAWVLRNSGGKTLKLLVYSSAGFTEKSGVHHKDDPNMRADKDWALNGAWDHAPMTKAIYRAASLMSVKERTSGKKQQQQQQ